MNFKDSHRCSWFDDLWRQEDSRVRLLDALTLNTFVNLNEAPVFGVAIVRQRVILLWLAHVSYHMWLCWSCIRVKLCHKYLLFFFFQYGRHGLRSLSAPASFYLPGTWTWVELTRPSVWLVGCDWNEDKCLKTYFNDWMNLSNCSHFVALSQNESWLKTKQNSNTVVCIFIFYQANNVALAPFRQRDQ